MGDSFPAEWIKAPDHAFGWQRKVNLDPQPFAVDLVDHVQHPELTVTTQPVGHEIHRIGDVRRIKHRQGVWLDALQPVAGFDPQVQFQLEVDAVNPLVV